jgi:hypothetical protein
VLVVERGGRQAIRIVQLLARVRLVLDVKFAALDIVDAVTIEGFVSLGPGAAVEVAGEVVDLHRDAAEGGFVDAGDHGGAVRHTHAAGAETAREAHAVRGQAVEVRGVDVPARASEVGTHVLADDGNKVGLDGCGGCDAGGRADKSCPLVGEWRGLCTGQ